jgi:hypothetical protein
MAGGVQGGRLWEKGVRYITLRSTVHIENSGRNSITTTFNLGIMVEIARIPAFYIPRVENLTLPDQLWH